MTRRRAVKRYVYSSAKKQKVTIGRNEACDICFLNRKEISSIHCKFIFENGTWMLYEGGEKPSMNGTWLYFKEPQEIKDRMFLKTGNVSFETKIFMSEQEQMDSGV